MKIEGYIRENGDIGIRNHLQYVGMLLLGT